MTRIKLFVHSSYGKWFCIKSWQNFANLFLLCKAPSKKKKKKKKKKNDFLDVESTHHENIPI